MKLWQALAVVTLLWAALYLPFLGSNELRGEEARRVLPAQTMLQGGSWAVPRIGGEEYSSKPPLINWTIAGLFALTGVQNEWTARLPSVLWLLAFAWVATGMLARRFGVWPAASVALFFLCSAGLLDKGRMAEIEAMYTAQTGIAYVLWAVWWTEGKRWQTYLVPALFLGLGMLAKGPMHLVCFYGAVVPALWMAKRMRELYQLPHLLSLAVIAAIFLPWLGLNLRQVQAADATSAVWLEQVAVRFSFRKIDWGEWVALPLEMLKNFLPGTVFLILLWNRPALQDLGEPDENERWRCVLSGGKLALLAGWILLSLSPEFRPRYAMPLFGIASVVVVGLLGALREEDSLAGKIDSWWRRLNRVGMIVLALSGVGAMAVAASGLLKGISWWHACPGLAAAVVLGMAWRRWDKCPPLATACAILAGAQILVFQFSAPWEEVRGLYRPVARDLHALIPEDGRQVLFYRPGHFRFLFYLDRPYVEVSRLEGEGAAGAGYLAVRESDLADQAVQNFLDRRKGVEIGRREIEKRNLVFFDLKSGL